MFPCTFRFSQDLGWLEFFAGKAECTKSMRRRGIPGVRFDIGYFEKECPKNRRCKSNFHDILSDSGFLLLDMCVFQIRLRLAVLFILKGRAHEFICWFAIKCSSWGPMNVGTSQRSAADCIGQTRHRSVLEANGMLERSDCSRTNGFKPDTSAPGPSAY